MRLTKTKQFEEKLSVKKQKRVIDLKSRTADDVKIESSDLLSLKALNFHFRDKKRVRRTLFLRHDPTNQCFLSLANIPPFLSKEDIESLLVKAIEQCAERETGQLSEIVPEVVFKRTTAVDKDLSAGYRSGSAIFQSADHAKCLLSKCESLPSISLEQIGAGRSVKTGFAKYVDEYNAKLKPFDQLLKSVNEAVAAYDEKKANEEEETKRKAKQPDADGWVKVTKNDKLSFKSKIMGKRAMDFTNQDDMLSVVEESSKRTKKRRS